jgi:hypothetical protein
MLAAFTGELGNRIEDKVWSMHSYQWGADTHVSKKLKAVSVRPQQQRCTSMDAGEAAIKDERICPSTI